MTNAEQIVVRLEEFVVIYRDIREQLAELGKLQQADQAEAEYRRETSAFDEELAVLTLQKGELEADKRKLKLKEEGGARDFRPPLIPHRPPADLRPLKPTSDESSRRPAPNQPAIEGTRRQLKKLVGRWGRQWRLSGDLQGRINRIADDPARPLGEALALLDWTTFANQISSSESEADHLERLAGWGRALSEYREWLDGEMDMLKTKYRRVLPILDSWIECGTDEGRRRWDLRISETLAAKRQDVQNLKDDINNLKTEIGEMKHS